MPSCCYVTFTENAPSNITEASQYNATHLRPAKGNVLPVVNFTTWDNDTQGIKYTADVAFLDNTKMTRTRENDSQWFGCRLHG